MPDELSHLPNESYHIIHTSQVFHHLETPHTISQNYSNCQKTLKVI